MKKQLLGLVSIPVLGALGSIAIRFKIYWLAITLYVLMIVIYFYVIITSKKVDKEVRELAVEFEDIINQGEVVNPVFSIKDKFFEEDKHILESYMKKIDYDASLMTDFLSGLLDSVSFQYREELLVGKKIKHSKVFTVISFKNNQLLESKTLQNPKVLNSKYKESYLVIDKEYISYYIEGLSIISKGFDSDDLLHKAYEDLIGFIRSMIYINETME